MKIAVLIISYNFEPWLERCLRSLREQTQPAWRVYVADNGSTDRTVERVAREFPEVVLRNNRANLGFARANNELARLAIDEGAEALFLMNEDAWLMPRCLEALAACARGNRGYGIISPVHLDGTGRKLDAGFAHYAGLSDVPPPGGDAAALVEAPFINAAFWLVSKAVWRELGGFSPRFYHYGEDVDFTNRLHHAGYAAGYCREARACHDRQLRPVSREKRLMIEEVYFRTVLFNPCHSAAHAFLYGVVAPVKEILKSLAKGRAADALSYAAITWRMAKAAVTRR